MNNQDGYQQARQLIKNANSVPSLTKAVEQVMVIIKECKLDDYQATQLEKFGLARFGQIEREATQMMKNERLTF